MIYIGVFRYPIWCCACLTLIVAAVTATEECNCLGPLEHYKDLNCTPIKYSNDCCAWRYDCDHLYDRILQKSKKCYVNGREYEIGESILYLSSSYELFYRTSFSRVECICLEEEDGLVDFKCENPNSAAYKLSHISIQGLQNSTTEISSNETEEVGPTCELDGIQYQLGKIKILKMPHLLLCTCKEKLGNYSFVCQEFIIKFDIHAAINFYRNCTPVYGVKKMWRCQNDDDFIVPAAIPVIYLNNTDTEISEDKRLCKFGNMTMRIGDRLNNLESSFHTCVVCICEVPPVLTCILKKGICDEFVRKELFITRKQKDGKEISIDCVITTTHIPYLNICTIRNRTISAICYGSNGCLRDPVLI